MIAHDIKAPLRNINNFSNLILNQFKGRNNCLKFYTQNAIVFKFTFTQIPRKYNFVGNSIYAIICFGKESHCLLRKNISIFIESGYRVYHYNPNDIQFNKKGI